MRKRKGYGIIALIVGIFSSGVHGTWRGFGEFVEIDTKTCRAPWVEEKEAKSLGWAEKLNNLCSLEGKFKIRKFERRLENDNGVFITDECEIEDVDYKRVYGDCLSLEERVLISVIASSSADQKITKDPNGHSRINGYSMDDYRSFRTGFYEGIFNEARKLYLKYINDPKDFLNPLKNHFFAKRLLLSTHIAVFSATEGCSLDGGDENTLLTPGREWVFDYADLRLFNLYAISKGIKTTRVEEDPENPGEKRETKIDSQQALQSLQGLQRLTFEDFSRICGRPVLLLDIYPGNFLGRLRLPGGFRNFFKSLTYYNGAGGERVLRAGYFRDQNMQVDSPDSDWTMASQWQSEWQNKELLFFVRRGKELFLVVPSVNEEYSFGKNGRSWWKLPLGALAIAGIGALV
ncbi:MAG: hypothetical protein LBN94_02400, partial [Puniceicoccales bacterium]|nr:hypothetical protein [Puniceicoccales bacterium]